MRPRPDLTEEDYRKIERHLDAYDRQGIYCVAVLYCLTCGKVLADHNRQLHTGPGGSAEEIHLAELALQQTAQDHQSSFSQPHHLQTFTTGPRRQDGAVRDTSHPLTPDEKASLTDRLFSLTNRGRNL